MNGGDEGLLNDELDALESPIVGCGRIEPLKLYGNNRDKQMAKAANRKRHAPVFPTRFGFQAA
ncbi:MAG TPA: hypothetical protein VF480_12245 [Verrucomicrobiae bacterium]